MKRLFSMLVRRSGCSCARRFLGVAHDLDCHVHGLPALLRGRGQVERLIPHRTRVRVAGRGPGVVVRLENARRPLVGSARVDLPALVHVRLDGGRTVIVNRRDVEVQA